MRDVLAQALSALLGIAVLALALYLYLQHRDAAQRLELSAAYGPADPAAWHVAQVMEEAREITRQAAEGEA